MPEYFTPDEVAAMFRVKRTTVLAWHRKGLIEATTLPSSNHLRFTQAAIDRFVDAGKTKAAG